MKRVIFIGPAPNRIGGVSIHIQRLTWLLRDQYTFDFVDEARGRLEGYYNIRSFDFFTYIKKIRQADIIHVHSGVFILRFFHILVARFLLRKPVVVSIHHDLAVEGKIGVTRYLLKHCDCAILDSQKIYDTVFVNSSRCIYRMMPAFLPPIEEREEPLPDTVKNWIDNVRKDQYSVLMCSSCSGIGEYKGVDLYGNDMSLEAVKILNEQQNDRHFYLIMLLHNSDKNPDTLKKYQDKVETELKDRVLLETTPMSFVKVMKDSDIVLRPTNTDGDSITVREALYFGKGMVASDCAVRPEGTVVFKTRDLQDYCDKILLSIEKKENEELKAPFDYKSFYKECYENSCGFRK